MQMASDLVTPKTSNMKTLKYNLMTLVLRVHQMWFAYGNSF
jgi:hypothetical protein